MVTKKKCKDCQQTKPIEEFGRCHGGRNPQPYCKPCEKIRLEAWRAKNGASEPADEATCIKCDKTKPGDQFYRSPTAKNGLQSSCKECTGARVRERKYGISKQEQVDMEVAQAGCCDICNRDLPLVVDHCHVGGQVRALLCKWCNAGLGSFGDDPERLIAAAEYLRRHVA